MKLELASDYNRLATVQAKVGSRRAAIENHDKAVKAVDPKAEVKVDLGSGKVEVQSDQDREAIAQAIREEGYTVGA